MSDDKKPMATFESGATSTTEKPWYHLIPLSGLRRVAERFAYGAKKHGDHNYKKGAYDLNFLRDRKNHMIEHAVKYAGGDTSTDHLGAILCNAMILAELEYIRSLEQPQQGVTIADLKKQAEIQRPAGQSLSQPIPMPQYDIDRENRGRRSEAFRDK